MREVIVVLVAGAYIDAVAEDFFVAEDGGLDVDDLGCVVLVMLWDKMRCQDRAGLTRWSTEHSFKRTVQSTVPLLFVHNYHAVCLMHVIFLGSHNTGKRGRGTPVTCHSLPSFRMILYTPVMDRRTYVE